MPNEYGKILLQQIEQQKRQRLQQRAEERGIPIPPDEQLRPSQNATARDGGGWTAQTSTSSRSTGDPPQEAEVNHQEKNYADALTEGKNSSSLQRKAMQESVDLTSALQSLAALAPLIARQPPYYAPHSEGISTGNIPSIVPAPLIHQQPLLLQPTALVHPPLYPLGSQQLPYLSQQQAHDRSTIIPMKSSGYCPDEPMPRERPPSNAVPAKEYMESKENLDQVPPSSGGALLSFSEADNGQQRIKDAKKKYQADLLKQMRERAAEREAEKCRRKREDEEERIRLSREIEQERLAKEEEDARQLVRSKQLAEANVAAAGPPKQRHSHQASNAPLESDLYSRQESMLSRRTIRDQEYAEQPHREDTVSILPEIKLRPDPENGLRRYEISRGRLGQQMPGTGVEAERCLLLGLEALQAEVRMQTEEMRCLKNQQDRVLQHIHPFRNVCCERQGCHANAKDSCAWHPSAHSRTTGMNTKMTADQHDIQAQYAFVTTVLKNAGVSDPEEMMRRFAESGAISMGCDLACPGMTPMDKIPCPYNHAAPDVPGQLVAGPSTWEAQRCGASHFSSNNVPLSRGPSNASCCSIHEVKQGVLPQYSKDGLACNKRDGTQVEDPEDRPLPTLLKRQQQPLHKEREPLPHPCDGAVHHQREQVHQHPIRTVKRPEESAEEGSGTSVEAGVKGKCEGTDERPCRAAGRTKMNNSANLPADRRWRFNELWACLSHGFPPPPALGPIVREPEKDRDDPLSATNSWCTSECESELPCQTILLPHALDCRPPNVGKRALQCVTRQVETISKDGWLPSNQMETLEESTAQSYVPEEHGQLSRQERELYEALIPRVEGWGEHAGIIVANGRVALASRGRAATSRFEAFNAHQPKQPLLPPAEVDFSESGKLSRENRLCSTNDEQICRELSVDAAPLKLQQLRQWDSQIRQRYNGDAPLKERCLQHLQAIANQTQAQMRPVPSAFSSRAQDRFKSRLSWEADTALPMDEGSPALPHIRQAEAGSRPFAPHDQAPTSPTGREEHNPSAHSNAESTSPTPAKPPSKHALPLQNPTRSSSVNVNNKKSRFARALGGVTLPRGNSRTRQ
ncbi:hypothetical protein, conserved [Eimeria brunetti]|uniref:CCDC66 domain-containing protein n=1 Tax=Eimeria brunetti TaxID=51314 RepID=U6LJN9_9EIME|nr:hypothetical protein, conserved [Eimeria brunetti]